MLLQTLPLVAMIFVIGFGLLTSQLVAVRHSIQQASTRDLGLAVDGAVIDVTRVIAGYVRDNGTTEGPWKSPTEQSPKTSTCTDDAPKQVCLYTTYRWRFTGASQSDWVLFRSSSAQSEAVNLQKSLIDEERVAVEIDARLITAKGDELGSRTRHVTFRVFNAAPYATAVGSYDVTAHLSSTQARQGDTAGDPESVSKQFEFVSPNPKQPDGYRDTTLHVTLTCENSFSNSNSADPMQDNHAAYGGLMAMNLHWGERDFAYETPCAPTYERSRPPSSAPSYPTDNEYKLSQTRAPTEYWNNGETTNTWMR